MAARMPRSTCRVPQDCALCPRRIRVGQQMAKDFGTSSWVHLGCLLRKINAESGKSDDA